MSKLKKIAEDEKQRVADKFIDNGFTEEAVMEEDKEHGGEIFIGSAYHKSFSNKEVYATMMYHVAPPEKLYAPIMVRLVSHGEQDKFAIFDGVDNCINGYMDMSNYSSDNKK